MGETAEKRQISTAEVRRTIAASLAAAFGFVIALVWKEVVMSGLANAGVDVTAAGGLAAWVIFTGVAVVLTVIMVILIVVIGRWGGEA